MHLKKLRPLWLALLLTSLIPSGALQAAILPAGNLLPADTFFVFTIPDFNALRHAAGQSPKWLLWNDPALKPFHDKFMSKWNEQFFGPLEQDLGVSLDEYLTLPQGQLTLAVTRNGWDGQDLKQVPGLLFLLDTKDQSTVLATNLDLLRKKWTAAGKSIRTETVHGVPFSVVSLSSNDVPPTLAGLIPANQPVQELGANPEPAQPLEMVFAQYQSLLIVGNSIKAVDPVVSHLTGGSIPSLADNAIFTADQASQFRNSPLFYTWLNAHALCAVIAQIPAAQPNPSAPTLFPPISPTMVLNASGLMSLKSVSISYQELPAGSLMTINLSVPEDGRQGLFKMLATGPKEAGAPAFVPADAVKFWRWRLDSQAFWTELQKTVAGVSPVAGGSLNGVIDMANSLAQQKDPTFDLRKNLIANLGDDWISYAKAPTGSSLADLGQERGILLFAAANPDQTLIALKTVASFSASQEGAPAPRDFLGHTIHTVNWRQQPSVGGTGATTPNYIYATTGGGYVAISLDASMLEEYIRSAGQPPRPLSETAGLADALQQIGGSGNGLFGYEDQRGVMKIVFAGLKQLANSSQPMPLLPKSFTDWIDYSLLPDYDQVAKYFYFTIFTGVTTPEGITYKSYAPRPPQLN
jgi:hypothetical protein